MSAVTHVTGEIVDNDAIEIGALYQKAGQGIFDSVHYAIQCGQRLIEKKATMKHGQWLSWLKSNERVLGFSNDRTARRFMEVANRTLAPDLERLELDDVTQISRQMWGHNNTTATKWTGDPESYTPAKYIEAAREVMGGIDPNTAKSFRRIEQGARRDYRQRFFWRRGTRAPQRAPDLGAVGRE